MAEAYLSLREHFPDDFPLAVWPEPGGFLPFANSLDGDEFGWLTEADDPDDWPLVIWPRHAAQDPPLKQGLTELLLAWLRGTYAPEGLAPLYDEDDPVECARFEPWTDAAHW